MALFITYSIYCDTSFYESAITILGVIVGILSILVMILIGWQVINTLTFDKKLRDAKKELEEKMLSHIKIVDDKMVARAFHTIGIVEIESGRYESALSSFYISIAKAVSLQDNDLIEDNIHFIKSYKDRNLINRILFDDFTDWVKVLSSINSVEAKDIIDFLITLDKIKSNKNKTSISDNGDENK